MKKFQEFINTNDKSVNEATVEMDAMNPEDKDFLKFLKKNKVEIIDTVMDGPAGGHPVITMQGKRKDLEKVLADSVYGWDDPGLAEYIEEAIVNEAMFSVKDLEKPGLIWWYNKKGDKAQVTKIDKIDNLNFPRAKDAPEGFNIAYGMGTLDQWVEKTGEKNPKVGEVYDIDESMVLKESRIVIKRKYTENHPAMTAGMHASIRNKVLEAIADGKLTKEEFDNLVREMSKDSGRWARRNARYFNVSEDGVSLSKYGRKIFNTISVTETETLEEGRKFVAAATKAKQEGKTEFEFDGKTYPVTVKDTPKIEEAKEVKETFLHESFSTFIESISLNEAFKSSLFASLFTKRGGKIDKNLAKAFYGTAKVKMDLIEDEDLLTMDPQTAYKNKQADTIIFYISDTPKENPHAPRDAWSDHKTIPGEGYLLAVASGDNTFYTAVWGGGRFSGGNRELALKKVDNGSTDSIGISKKYKGWDGTGLYNVKRIAEVADRAIVLNMALLRQKYSSEGQRAERASAKKGAVAFKSDKDFKKDNMARYQEILANKAASLPLDKMVADAIEALTTQIKDGLAKGEKGRYGDIIIGRKANGSEAKMRDASNHMSNILDDYSRYVDYIKQAEESEARYGDRESYYERESKNYAKNIKDKINQIESFDYVW
jgi:hypothetical protein